jgi:hypothetical protein
MLILPTTTSAKPLPCLDSSPECIDQLTEQAIANSPQLQTIKLQVEILKARDGLIEQRLSYTRSSQWTNFLTLDPLKLVQTLFGGGDFQDSEIAIADLEIKKATLEAQQAGFLWRESEIKTQLREQILSLVLDYEATVRQRSVTEKQLKNQQLLQQVIEIDYRSGAGSTQTYLASLEKTERLESQLTTLKIQQEQSLRRLLAITGFEP